MAGRTSGHRLATDQHSIPGLMHTSLSPATPRSCWLQTWSPLAESMADAPHSHWARLFVVLLVRTPRCASFACHICPASRRLRA